MKTKLYILIALLFVSEFAVGQTNEFSRQYYFTEDLDVFPEPQRLEFYQRERVVITYKVLRDNEPINFSDQNFFAVWEGVTQTNPTTAYIVSTAEVVSATSGVIRFTLSPVQAMIPEGFLDGFVRLFKRQNNDIIDQGVIQRQNINIRRSPPSEYINFVGPTWWDRYDPNTLIIDGLVVNTLEAQSLTLGGQTVYSFPSGVQYKVQSLSSSYLPTKYQLHDYQGTGSVFGFKWIAGESGISITDSQNVLVISGNATQSVTQFFPIQGHNRGRIYVRQGSNPGVITALDVPTNAATPALSSDGTNIFWANGVPASDAVLFNGQGPDFYKNFRIMTNIPVYEPSAVVPLIGLDIDGFEAGSNVAFNIESRVDPLNATQTISVLRMDIAGSLGTNVDALLTRENIWEKKNTFDANIWVKDRIRMYGVVDNSGFYASVGIGGTNLVASGPYSTVIGGRGSTASGSDSISGGRGSTAAAASSIALGTFALAGGDGAVAMGKNNYARGTQSTAIGGANNDVLSESHAIGGTYVELEGANNWAFGSSIFSDKSYVYLFGDGELSAPITAQTNRSFILMGTTTGSTKKTYFMGINTNAPSTSNVVLEARGGRAYFEGIVFPNGTFITNGSFGGIGNASLSSAWSVVYSDGQTNSISLRLGESNSVLVSMGSNAAPRFVKDGLGGGTITSITADVNHFVVTGSTGPATVISLNATAATNLWKAEQSYNYLGGIANISNRVVSLEGYTNGIINISNRVVSLEAYTNGIINVSNRMVSVESSLNNVSGRVVSIESYLPGIANVSGRVVTLESNLQNVSNRVGTLETTVATLGSGTITNIKASSDFSVASPSGPEVNISLSSTVRTNLWKAETAYSWGNHSTQGYATGTPLYAFTETDPTALTNVTASGLLSASRSGKQIELSFNASNLATGTPLYAFTETDPVWASEKSLYATGAPLYAFTETNWSLYPAKQNVNIGGFSATNILELGFTTNNLTNPAEARMRWNEDFETVMVGLHGGYALPVGESVVYPVVNQTGSQINKGTLVSAAGTLGNSGKILVEPAFTNTNMPSHMIMGVVPADIPNGDQGYAVHFGRVRGLNMTNYSEGAVLYANPSVAGGFTTNVPLAPKSKTIVALVVNNSQNQGTIWVRPTLGSSLANDELVNLGTLTTNDTIVYDYAANAFTNRTLGSSAFVGTNTFINVINGTGTVNALSAGGIRITGTVNTNDLKSVPTLETLATYNPLGAVTNATLLSLSGTPYNGILNLDPARFSTNVSGELTVDIPPSINATNIPSGAGEILVSSDNTKSNLYFTKATIFSAFEIDLQGRLMPRASTNFFDAFWALDGNGDLYPVSP